MVYPLNLLTSTDPVTGYMRPFILFMLQEPKINIMKVASWSDVKNINIPKGCFSLPMPNSPLEDSVSNDYSTDNDLRKIETDMMGSGGTAGKLLAQNAGITADPLMSQTYMGTKPRTFSGEWQLMPQNIAESAAIAGILWTIKHGAAPAKLKKSAKLGLLAPPYTYKLVFGNPQIQAALKYNDMALTSYSIKYFSNGYASSYWDLMPKKISLSLSFAEFGIKYREDWEKVF